MHNLSKEIYTGKKKAFENGDEAVAMQIGKGKDILSVLSTWSFFEALTMRNGLD